MSWVMLMYPSEFIVHEMKIGLMILFRIITHEHQILRNAMASRAIHNTGAGPKNVQSFFTVTAWLILLDYEIS